MKRPSLKIRTLLVLAAFAALATMVAVQKIRLDVAEAERQQAFAEAGQAAAIQANLIRLQDAAGGPGETGDAMERKHEAANATSGQDQ
jgi:hypothetical protein